MKTYKIGLPKALHYYKYKELWWLFFEKLGCQIVVSPDTNKEILENGIKYSPDEACVSLKIYMGHVYYLLDKCDYILVPRLECIKKHEMLCTNFYALYDLVKNTFDTKLIHYNVDVKNNLTEEKAFIKMGISLGFSKKKSLEAYHYAKEIRNKKKNNVLVQQEEKIKKSQKIKILLAGHPYNLYDEFVGAPIKRLLVANNVDVIYSDIYDVTNTEKDVLAISKTNYWTYNKEIMAAISHYENKVDGIILITSFPCGPDSLSNEMILRNINIPITNIIIDEADSNTGLVTRIESFIDILEERRRNHD